MKRTKHNYIHPAQPVAMVHMSQDYGSSVYHLLKDHDYQICSMLDIGYFVFSAGHLLFLPIQLQGIAYTIFQTVKE